jgi:hypothetical protein
MNSENRFAEDLETIDDIVDRYEDDLDGDCDHSSTSNKIGIIIIGPSGDESVPDLQYLMILPPEAFYYPSIQLYLNSFPIPPHYQKSLAIFRFQSSERGYNPIVKTFWIKMIQRKFKKAYANRKKIIETNSIHKYLQKRELSGRFPRTVLKPLISGLLQ